LPFEGAGAESTWKLDLPKDYPAFDYATISDVILHVRYTARQGVDPTKVKAALDDLLQPTGGTSLALLLSLRHDFPSEWWSFTSGTDDFTAVVRRDYFPYFSQHRQVTIEAFDLYEEKAFKRHPVGNQATFDVATADLSDDTKRAFTFTIPPDGPGPTQVLTRSRDAEPFLIVRYSLS
jgi:hypothetical protein